MTQIYNSQFQYDNAEPEVDIKFSDTFGFDEWIADSVKRLLAGDDVYHPTEDRVLVSALDANEALIDLIYKKCEEAGL